MCLSAIKHMFEINVNIFNAIFILDIFMSMI